MLLLEGRNLLQRATQAARGLLEQEYAEQLEGVFDIRLDGAIAEEPGEHLDGIQKVQRAKLVTAVEHLRGAGNSKADAVAAYLREAAFTTLNRFVALKMLEARERVPECVSRGELSAGFKAFTGRAPGLAQLPDHGYRAYIECIFDEVSTEVKVLFERRDVSASLWPKQATLDALLDLLNAADLSDVWAEDETIGWVYQFFNGDEERKLMSDRKRGGLRAPHNSRQMAVRNQFFTPRYAVQFLTDNTLGRVWYEMRQGETVLRDQCEYLVRKPNEVFLRTSGPFKQEWLQRFVDGDLSALPETFDWEQSAEFAHLIDGYRLSPVLGLGDVGDLANAALRRSREPGRSEPAIEKWLRLFFEHRRSRHAGIEPSGEGRQRLDELCQQLRALLAEPAEGVKPLELVQFRQAKDPRDLRVLDPACGSGHFLLYAFDLLLPIYEEAYVGDNSPVSEATGRTLAQDYPSLEDLRKAVPGLILAHNLHGVDIDARCVQSAQLALWMRAQRAYRDFGFVRGERAPIRKSNIVVTEPLVADDQLVAEFVTKAGDAAVGRVFTELVDALKLAGDLGLLPRVENAEDAIQGMGLLGIAEKKYDVVLTNPLFGETTQPSAELLAE